MTTSGSLLRFAYHLTALVFATTGLAVAWDLWEPPARAVPALLFVGVAAIIRCELALGKRVADETMIGRLDSQAQREPRLNQSSEPR